MRSGSPLRAERDEHVVPVDGHSVALAYDPDGAVWYVQASSVPGLVGQASDLDDLVDDLPRLIRAALVP